MKYNRLSQDNYDYISYHLYNNHADKHPETTEKLFPEFLPVAYYNFWEIDRIHLFIFNSNGKIFKHGFCYRYELYNSAGLKPFEDLLMVTLYNKLSFEL